MAKDKHQVIHGRLLFVAALISMFGAVAEATELVSVPAWIWATDSGEPQRVLLRTSFTVGETVQHARIRCAADFCQAEVILDNDPLLTIEEYGPWVDEDITHRIRRGVHTLSLRCISSDGPAAVALHLRLTEHDDTIRDITTGTQWQARVVRGSSKQKHIEQNAIRWNNAVSFGQVAAEHWGVDARSIRINSFDDYEQWKRALGASNTVEPSAFLVPQGFEIQKLRAAREDEGSWVSMAVDPQGELVIAREDKGLLRMTLSDDRKGVALVETINDSLLECRGLLFAHDALYVNANNSKGLYRLCDTNGDGRFDETKLLREFPGGVGHGRNDLALGPDGMIYSIHGDAVDVPAEDITDRTSPFREARRGQRTSEGHVIRTNRDGTECELICGGLRNPFGIDFHPEHGEPFTYDADAEFDMGAPWYRPTRVVHLMQAADYGWRGVTGSWPPYDPDRPDNAIPALDIGKGSPTAVKFGHRSHFPPRYRHALFILDWAYGRIIAVHLIPRGASYYGQAEVFLRGRPLNVTDLDFGPDGAMYFVTGGRKTQSALYRVKYVGSSFAPTSPTRQQVRREQYSADARKQRRQLESILRDNQNSAVTLVWPYLNHGDPALRYAARMVLEQRPVPQWQDRALAESRTTAALSAILALARSGQAGFRQRALRRLNEFDFRILNTTQKLTMLRIYELRLANRENLDEALLAACTERLTRVFPDSAKSYVPTGLGRSVNRELSRLVLLLDAPGAVAKTMLLMQQSTDQDDRLHYLYVLRNASSGWTMETRRAYFVALNQASDSRGGRGMPGFLQTIRDEAMSTLTDEEQVEIADLLDTNNVDDDPIPQRPFVRDWRIDDLVGSLERVGRGRDYDRGKSMFREALCSRCHRVGTDGAVVGPDLTAVSARFSRQDLLKSIIQPSEVVAESYRNVEIETIDGQVIVGQVTIGGDYRSPMLRIATDPLRPAQSVQIRKQDIQMHRQSKTSPMPEGLLNVLSREQILDLLAYLESAGKRTATNFKE